MIVYWTSRESSQRGDVGRTPIPPTNPEDIGKTVVAEEWYACSENPVGVERRNIGVHCPSKEGSLKKRTMPAKMAFPGGTGERVLRREGAKRIGVSFVLLLELIPLPRRRLT
jgi:hypothetical protein